MTPFFTAFVGGRTWHHLPIYCNEQWIRHRHPLPHCADTVQKNTSSWMVLALIICSYSCSIMPNINFSKCHVGSISGERKFPRTDTHVPISFFTNLLLQHCTHAHTENVMFGVLNMVLQLEQNSSGGMASATRYPDTPIASSPTHNGRIVEFDLKPLYIYFQEQKHWNVSWHVNAGVRFCLFILVV